MLGRASERKPPKPKPKPMDVRAAEPSSIPHPRSQSPPPAASRAIGIEKRGARKWLQPAAASKAGRAGSQASRSPPASHPSSKRYVVCIIPQHNDTSIPYLAGPVISCPVPSKETSMDGRPPLRCQEETSGPSLYVGAALFSPTRPRHTCSSHHPIPSNTPPSSPYHPWLAPPLSDRRMLAHPVNVLPPLASIQVVVGADALRSGARRSSAPRERYACVLPSCLATAPRLPFMYTCVSDDEV